MLSCFSLVWGLWDPMDCSPPGFSVHGILQARILKWIAMPSSMGYSWPRYQTHVSCLLQWQVDSLPLVTPGKPPDVHIYMNLYAYMLYVYMRYNIYSICIPIHITWLYAIFLKDQTHLKTKNNNNSKMSWVKYSSGNKL